MIFRAHEQRNGGSIRSYSGANRSNDVVSGPSSQECSQDVYDFTFPSQESRQLTFPQSRKVRDRDGDFWKSKKLEVIDVDSEPCGSSAPQESDAFGVFEFIDVDNFEKPKKTRKVSSDPYEYNSSESDGFGGLPQRNGRENRAIEFSGHGDLRKSNKLKNDDSCSYGFNSSLEWGDAGVSKKSKMDRGKNWGLQKKKIKNKKKKIEPKESESGDVEITARLVETNEYDGMEDVDEVNIALDGLKKGQPERSRRASLLSLLSICATAEQRRVLRMQGMTKTIIDAVLGLSIDDLPSNLAAAALIYILTSDDNRLLDSPSCIFFLIKLLKPLKSSAAKEKTLPIGSRVLGLCKSAGSLQHSAKGMDSSSTAITLKVKDILVGWKEIKPRDGNDSGVEEPELNPKWISLLTMEKACSSSIAIEDTFGTVRKRGGKFKEKLRECGGLDAVFEVARKCHTTMEEWVEKSPTFAFDLKDFLGLESLALLLKCLKIMENATFLSKDNQRHLLRIKRNFDGQQAPRSFMKLVLSIIKILSGVSLLRNSSSSRSGQCSNVEWTSQGSFNGSQGTQSFMSSLELTQGSVDPLLLKLRVKSSIAGSCSVTSSDTEFGIRKRHPVCTNSLTAKDSQDPFAFHEDDDGAPSKWDLLSGRGKMSLSQDSRVTVSGYKDWNGSLIVSSQQESNNLEYPHSQETSCSSSVDENKSELLGDCLLTAVKVLMNLTNDNAEGCQQIATYGGLEILSSLIAGHFPSFSLSIPGFEDVREINLLSKSSPIPKINQGPNTPLTDQELDFLVAILGLLVNLVEKDSQNRSRLAATSVSLPSLECSGLEGQTSVISLLCSIFLANQGSNEPAGEENSFSLEDEDSLIQGEREAEKMIVEAYAALLLAFLSTESKSVRNTIAKCLPNQKLAILVPVLERFVEFHLTLNVISPDTHSAVLEVIESCKTP